MLSAVLAPALVPGSGNEALAQTCTVSGGTVTLTSGSCAIPPGQALTGPTSITASGSGQITANGVRVTFGSGAGSIGGHALNSGRIIFGVADMLGGSTISSDQGGGGSKIGLLADGVPVPSQIAIEATGLGLSFGQGGSNVGARAMNGQTISLHSGTTITMDTPGGRNTGLWATNG